MILTQINIWVLKTFHREWRVITSNIPESLVLKGPLDPFEAVDISNPDDLLNHLDPLAAP